MTTSAPETTGTSSTSLRGARGGTAGDSIFSGLALTSAVLILMVLAFVAVFLVGEALPALQPGADLPSGGSFFEYVWPLMAGTLMAAVIALLLATPVAIGVALFISHYAAPRIAQPVGFLIDLLAAIPSVVYGVWGWLTLAPLMVPIYEWLNEYLGFIPFFAGTPTTTGRTILTSGVVLAVMVLPIITALCREIFTQTPKLHEEAALGLGATRWEMIRMTVFPFARAGIISSVMLGLGRALGETMAVTMVLSGGIFSWSLVESGRNQTIPSEIALNFPEAFGMRLNELIAAGLMLFIITLAVNMIARAIVNKHKEFSGAN
ncbi:phosphate ABC transporter permease subunit PstC [Micrococcus sp.]|uniref:phosphate ABC transporter permease subunit PstC n=1 Tax=Micrococcus sp. TaxID=1271 RepID=UPI002A919D6E|nr:phosphate ABC transporter permease subunit PstC [Micrococcus sp.]MDY6056033.1 phosphate ABC transporter permease subunit PstC [Micrococcus sp.]